MRPSVRNHVGAAAGFPISRERIPCSSVTSRRRQTSPPCIRSCRRPSVATSTHSRISRSGDAHAGLPWSRASTSCCPIDGSRWIEFAQRRPMQRFFKKPAERRGRRCSCGASSLSQVFDVEQPQERGLHEVLGVETDGVLWNTSLSSTLACASCRTRRTQPSPRGSRDRTWAARRLSPAAYGFVTSTGGRPGLDAPRSRPGGRAIEVSMTPRRGLEDRPSRSASQETPAT